MILTVIWVGPTWMGWGLYESCGVESSQEFSKKPLTIQSIFILVFILLYVIFLIFFSPVFFVRFVG